MSFEVFLFRLAPGVSVEEVNDFMVEEFEEWWDEMQEAEESDGEENPNILPEKYVDGSVTWEEMFGMIARPFARTFRDWYADDHPETAAFFEKHQKGEPIPEEHLRALIDSIEWQMMGGALPLSTGYDNAPWLYGAAASVLKEATGERLVVADLEYKVVVDASNAEELMGTLAKLFRADNEGASGEELIPLYVEVERLRKCNIPFEDRSDFSLAEEDEDSEE